MADVICPGCGGRYHETTDQYKPGVATRGNMLRLKDFYRENGWVSFPEHADSAFGDLECPDCGSRYTENGMVRIDEMQYASEIGRKEFPGTQYADIQPSTKKQTGRPRKQR